MDTTQFANVLVTLPLHYVLWGTLVTVLVVFVIFSGVLLWHWKLYSTGRYTTYASGLVYIAVSMFFIVLMVLGASWYTLAI